MGLFLTRGVRIEGEKKNTLGMSSFFVAALLSVIQTVTFRTAAESIRPARRLHWKHRGPVVKHKHAAHIHTLQRKNKKCGASFIKPSFTEMKQTDKQFSLLLTLFFICAIVDGSSCSHLCVPFFCLFFGLFLPPASLRRLLRDVLCSLRL